MQRFSNWKDVLIELVAVFVGVYLAFALSNYQEEQKNEKTRIKYFKSFLLELQGINYTIKRQLKIIERIDSVYTESIQNKRFKIPEIYPDFELTINMPIIKSAFIGSHFENIHPQFLLNISFGGNLITMIEKRVNRYTENCQRVLYGRPMNARSFYQSSGQLKREYQWYLDDLRSIKVLYKRLNVAIEEGALPETKKLIEGSH